MRRETGGNRFIDGDATKYDLLSQIMDGLADLEQWFEGTGRALDIGALSVETQRIASGKISVEVSCDSKPREGATR